MSTIFWVTCPCCRDRFYCHEELRNADWKLRCPYCEQEFAPEEGLRNEK